MPCRQQQFLQETLHSNLDVQGYMDGKFVGVVCGYRVYLGVDIEALQHNQQ